MSAPLPTPRKPRKPAAPTENPHTAPALRGWMLRVNETLRTRVSDLLTSAADELSRLKVSDVRALVQELDTHQVELEQQNEELRLAQLALLESRDRLSDLYEFAPVGYLTLDAQGVIRKSNLAAAQLLGAGRSKLIGRRFAALVVAGDAAVFQKHLSLAQGGDSKAHCEITVNSAERKQHALRLRLESTCIRSAEAACTRSCQVALIDITQALLDQERLNEMNRGLERAVTERTRDLSESLTQLRANEERLALALDAGLMGSWTFNLQSRRVWHDERHARLYGRTGDSAHETFEGWLATLHPEDRERMALMTARTISGKEPVLAAEYRIVWADGSAHWLSVRGRLVRDARGKPSQLVGVEQDIDERKGLEMEVLHIADHEQRRIGQELHDDIQQRLTGLGLMAESLCEVLGHKSAPENLICARLTRGISETTERVNQLSHGLLPLELDGERLVVALHRLAVTTDASGPTACVFRHDEDIELRDSFSATHLYRIAQEAITNALRHSGARCITLSLRHEAGGVRMCVADDGIGMSTGSNDGRGLRIMAYRASLIGATFRVAKGRSSGTVISCFFMIGAMPTFSEQPS